jgi:hypothetical protein
MLLEVYMKAGESRATEASRLLNAQAVNLDALDVSVDSCYHIKTSLTICSFRRSSLKCQPAGLSIWYLHSSHGHSGDRYTRFTKVKS